MIRILFLLGSLTHLSVLYSATMTSPVFDTQNKKSLGTITFEDTPYGLLITPKLTSLPPGGHGLHLHQHPSCKDHGMSAGGHFDPNNTKTHKGPYGEGHLGDLPLLYVDNDKNASTPTLAPRLKTRDLKGLTIMIHEGGDNYSDQPPLGGGGRRVGCGLIQEP